MLEYHNLLSRILEEGEPCQDRTGTGTKAIFGAQMRFSMIEGFPLITTKKLHLKSVIHELLWFLKGDTNTHYLEENGVTIWREWADENGDLGPIYGHQWRDFFGVDQIAKLVEQIKNNPDSRRMIDSAWNPQQLPLMALPPCHTLWQVRVMNGRLHLHLYQRSADMFLGVPFNIASYALLLHMLAAVTDKIPGDLIISIGDAHIYNNHFDQVKELLSRVDNAPPLPLLGFRRWPVSIFDFTYEDFVISGYFPMPAIAAPVAV
jgi:thymidylate synthase